MNLSLLMFVSFHIRAIADQVYGDAEMHDVVRKNAMDFIVRGRENLCKYSSIPLRIRRDHTFPNGSQKILLAMWQGSGSLVYLATTSKSKLAANCTIDHARFIQLFLAIVRAWVIDRCFLSSLLMGSFS